MRGPGTLLVRPQVVADRVEHRAQRAVPAALVDPHPRPRDLPGVTDCPIEITGNADAVRDLLALLDTFELWFDIVTP